MHAIPLSVLTIFVFLSGVQHVYTRPHDREKRVSDSHLSNLETYLALNKYKRRLSETTPINQGQLSPYILEKRLSGHHLSDLETKIALNNKIKGLAITLPIGAGLVNPYQIGRKRRSDPTFINPLFDYPSEDDATGSPAALNYVDDDVQFNYQF